MDIKEEDLGEKRGRGLSLSRSRGSLSGLKRTISKGKVVNEQNHNLYFFLITTKVNYNAVLKSGYLSKRKEGKKKWDYRYCVLTTGHLCWFKDKDKRDKQEPCGVIDLKNVSEVTFGKAEIEHANGDLISINVKGIEQQDPTLYFFGDLDKTSQNKQWKAQIDHALSL